AQSARAHLLTCVRSITVARATWCTETARYRPRTPELDAPTVELRPASIGPLGRSPNMDLRTEQRVAATGAGRQSRPSDHAKTHSLNTGCRKLKYRLP